MKKILPWPIEGERLFLRPFETEDAEALFALIDADRSRLRRYLPWPDFIHSIEDELAFCETSRAQWLNGLLFGSVIVRKADHQILGCIGTARLDRANEIAEVGYWIGAPYEGAGYMAEACTSLVDALFEFGVHRVELRTAIGNTRSEAIPTRLGFRLEGIHLAAIKLRAERLDVKLFALLENEWLSACR